jgi:hypothetical protein
MRAMTRTPILLLLLLPLLAAGCEKEPFERPGTWRAGGVNDDNLRAMLADPGDLSVRPTPAPSGPGSLAAEAAARLRRGETRPLLDGGLGRSSAATPPAMGGNGAAQ